MRIDPNNSHVILFGASKFPQDPDLAELPSVYANLVDLKAVIADPTVMGLPELNIIEVLNPENQAAVMEPLERISAVTDDVLLVYYAGHGLLDRNGKLYLALRDSTQTGAHYNALSWDLVRGAIAESRARVRVVILDCCFSGRAMQAMTSSTTAIKGQIDFEGAVTIASAPPNELALAPAGERNTAFTGALLDILVNGIPSLDFPYLDLETTFQCVRNKLSNSGRPIPQLFSANTASRYALFANVAFVKRTVVQPPPEINSATTENVKADWDAIWTTGLLAWGKETPFRWKDSDSPTPRLAPDCDAATDLSATIRLYEHEARDYLDVYSGEPAQDIANRAADVGARFVIHPEEMTDQFKLLAERCHEVRSLKLLLFTLFETDPPGTPVADFMAVATEDIDDVRPIYPTCLEGAVLLLLLDHLRRLFVARDSGDEEAQKTFKSGLTTWALTGFDCKPGEGLKIRWKLLRNRESDYARRNRQREAGA